MSRSYKRTPFWGDSANSFYKNYSNRKLRRISPEDFFFRYSSYKKHLNSNNIRDYHGYISFERFAQFCKEFYEDVSNEEIMRKYIKCFKRK